MRLLEGKHVLALEEAAHGALARFFRSLGARVQTVELDEITSELHNADFLIDRRGLAALEDSGISHEDLASRHPTLIHVSVSPFGSFGPRARWRGSELVASAMGGTLRLTGEPDRPPVKEALDACWFHADMAGAAGALAALCERAQSGLGQHVDVSVQEVAFSRNVNGILVWQFDRRTLRRVGGALNYGRATVRCIWPLADGYCFHTLMTGRFGAPANQALSDWMDECGIDNPLRGTNWERYNRSTLDPEVRARWEAAIEAFFRTRTKKEIREEGRRRGINATVVAEPADVLADPHLQAREFWTESKRPSRFVRVTPGPTAPARTNAAPVITRPGPLSGIRVLDFSWALVGSITTKILGDLGCDVVKIETRSRPCLSRIDVQVSASRPDSLDDKPWFAHLNTSKRSLSLNMKHAASRDILRPLIEWADVVVENFSPGTMAKLGLDYEKLIEINPRIVMASGSVFGQTGPLAHEWGIDGTGGALSGRTFLTGWPDRAPVTPGAVPYGDVIVPYAMAAAIAGALNRRNETGAGCHIDASMYELCVQQMDEAFKVLLRGEVPTRMGNRDASVFHQGVYPAAGDDRWVAITLHDAADWKRLSSAIGCAESADIDSAIAEWTRTRPDIETATHLQSLGIAAGAVQDVPDLIERDPQIAARGALMQLDHAMLGAFGHVRTPMTFSRSRVEPYRAPAMGEHSIEVLTTVCGISPERAKELAAEGALQ
jgi:crotonobetainyl-CoA:carnitine CoA-transferase CaiB-like acyl-CoA transferase